MSHEETRRKLLVGLNATDVMPSAGGERSSDSFGPSISAMSRNARYVGRKSRSDDGREKLPYKKISKKYTNRNRSKTK